MFRVELNGRGWRGLKPTTPRGWAAAAAGVTLVGVGVVLLAAVSLLFLVPAVVIGLLAFGGAALAQAVRRLRGAGPGAAGGLRGPGDEGRRNVRVIGPTARWPTARGPDEP